MHSRLSPCLFSTAILCYLALYLELPWEAVALIIEVVIPSRKRTGEILWLSSWSVDTNTLYTSLLKLTDIMNYDL